MRDRSAPALVGAVILRLRAEDQRHAADNVAAASRALSDFVRRARAGRILELQDSGLWEGDLTEMRRDRPE